jgi:hypothetical protein
MSVFKSSSAADLRSADGAASEFVTRNIATTAGVVAGAGTVVAGAALLTAALPVQMTAAVGTTGALLYIGHRQSNGLPAIPGIGKSDDAAPADAVADTAPAAA